MSKRRQFISLGAGLVLFCGWTSGRRAQAASSETAASRATAFFKDFGDKLVAVVNGPGSTQDKRRMVLQIWRARQAGVPPSSANGMGVGISLSCAPAMAPPCGRETTRSRFGVTSDFDALLPAEKSRPWGVGGSFCLMRAAPLTYPGRLPSRRRWERRRHDGDDCFGCALGVPQEHFTSANTRSIVFSSASWVSRLTSAAASLTRIMR
jgi:hypothetical protein